MSTTVCASDYEKWDEFGLAEYEDFSDCINCRNERELGDCSAGDWFFIPDDRLPGGQLVIYTGSWGYDFAPGASSYTYAEVFEEDEVDDFNLMASVLRSQPEFEEVPEEDD